MGLDVCYFASYQQVAMSMLSTWSPIGVTPYRSRIPAGLVTAWMLPACPGLGARWTGNY